VAAPPKRILQLILGLAVSSDSESIVHVVHSNTLLNEQPGERLEQIKDEERVLIEGEGEGEGYDEGLQ